MRISIRNNIRIIYVYRWYNIIYNLHRTKRTNWDKKPVSRIGLDLHIYRSFRSTYKLFVQNSEMQYHNLHKYRHVVYGQRFSYGPHTRARKNVRFPNCVHPLLNMNYSLNCTLTCNIYNIYK